MLRHRTGDAVDVIDGLGTLYHCRLTDDSPKGAEAEILSEEANWGAHPYHLTISCCPTLSLLDIVRLKLKFVQF